MSQMSDFLEVELRKHIFRTGSYTKPTVLAVGLYTAAPSDAGGGTEVTGGSYARVTTNAAPLDANWTAASSTDGITTNALVLTFPTPSANWGVVTHFGIFDAATVGNLLIWGPLTASKTINNGDPAPTFPAGSLAITFA
jgi:hypothetical protein